MALEANDVEKERFILVTLRVRTIGKRWHALQRADSILEDARVRCHDKSITMQVAFEEDYTPVENNGGYPKDLHA